MPSERVTGAVIADVIICCLKVWSLSLADLRGQCYDAGPLEAGRLGRPRPPHFLNGFCRPLNFEHVSIPLSQSNV